MAFYAGAGYIADGGAGYEDAEEPVDDLDAYDWEFEGPPGRRERRPLLEEEEEGPAESERGREPEAGPAPETRPGAIGGEPVIRREERTREHPQFATRYEQDVDPAKLREALEWVGEQTGAAVRWDDIHDRAGEIAGVGYWIGLPREASLAAFIDTLHEALAWTVGIDIARSTIGAMNLRRGLERGGATIKQSFFRFFLPAPGWKLFSDWTIAREGEKKSDVHPDIQTMARERQRARRAEIMAELKEALFSKKRAAEEAAREAARLEAERRAEELRVELARQEAARLEAERRAEELRVELARQEAARLEAERRAEELRAEARHVEELRRAEPPPGWQRAAERAGFVLVPLPPPGWQAAVERATERRAEEKRERAEARREERRAEAMRLIRRARYLEGRAGTSRTRLAREQRSEAQELRERAARLRR